MSLSAAQTLSQHVAIPTGDASIALLCTSSRDFVLTWVGLMRLGFSVLLLAWVSLGCIMQRAVSSILLAED